MTRIKSLTEAVLFASNVCQNWISAEDGTRAGGDEMMELARKRDLEQPLDEDRFYMISREGAIGVAFRREYLTQWVFLPAEDFPNDAVPGPAVESPKLGTYFYENNLAKR